MRNPRTWVYVIVAFVVAGLALHAPGAWATPDRSPSNQTVPTLAPSPTFKAPTPIITPAPGPGLTPGPGPKPGATGQPGPQPNPAPAATQAASGALWLTAVVSPTMAWPGARLQFTVTLANAGSRPLDQVVLDEYLSEGLQPEMGGSRYVWDERRHLSVPFGTLPPGQQIVVPFSVVVTRDVKPGSVLQLVSTATAGGIGQSFLQTLVALPPAELPRTGGGFAAP